jgi:NAD(P)H-hydrate epimerase
MPFTLNYANATPVFDTASIKALEQEAMSITSGGASVLMEKAGMALFRYIQQHYPTVTAYHIVCGTGNNGGDGFVLARLAVATGIRVQVYIDAEPKAADARIAYSAMRKSGIEPADAVHLAPVDGLVIDCIFGTGVSNAPRAPWNTCIERINAAALPVVSVDVPSGLDADTGHAPGTVVVADHTLTFIGLKPGLLTGHGPAVCGRIIVDTLGTVSTNNDAAAFVVTKALLRGVVSKRSRIAHKGAYGHVLVVGGDAGYGGAALLTATAALRTGAGLVSVVTHTDHVAGFLSARPELMVNGVSGTNQRTDRVKQLLNDADVVVVGPGLGRRAFGRALYELVIEHLNRTDKPAVLDADALNLLAEQPRYLPSALLTPHPGEAARLLNRSVAEINAARLHAAGDLVSQYGAGAVLKGAGSVVSDGEQAFICTAGNPGMASGGMGDVLSGIIGGLLAQRLAPTHALMAGVWLHAVSADMAVTDCGEQGLLAGDLIDALHLPLSSLVQL